MATEGREEDAEPEDPAGRGEETPRARGRGWSGRTAGGGTTIIMWVLVARSPGSQHSPPTPTHDAEKETPKQMFWEKRLE